MRPISDRGLSTYRLFIVESYSVLRPQQPRASGESGVGIWCLRPQIRTPDTFECAPQTESGGNLRNVHQTEPSVCMHRHLWRGGTAAARLPRAPRTPNWSLGSRDGCPRADYIAGFQCCNPPWRPARSTEKQALRACCINPTTCKRMTYF